MKVLKIHKKHHLKAVSAVSGVGADYETVLAQANTIAKGMQAELEQRVLRIRASSLNEGGAMVGSPRGR